MAKKQFRAESKRLLDLMINSIYTHKEIFLREIISNASDAIDKLCYQSLTDEHVGMSRSDFRILVRADKDARTITVSDNGIGMSKEELDQNLGVIAASGSLKFKNGMEEKPAEGMGDLDIIGQFGVGFYSAFMVSDEVTVTTKKYGETQAWLWSSSGAEGYTVAECEKESVGTDVVMHIKADADGDDYSEFLDGYRLQALVKKYSDYIRWPIVMAVDKSEMEETEEKDEDGNPKRKWVTHTEDQTVNSMIPIWQRAKSEVTEDDYTAWYRAQYHDENKPARIITVNAEGKVSFRALLFIPSAAPYDYYTKGFQGGPALYSAGVMIKEHCEELLPDYFRFVCGVVDTQDLSLNISREMLQHDRHLKAIEANLTKRIKSELLKLMADDRETYEKFYASFGTQLKYGVVSDYGMNAQELRDLLLFASSKSEETPDKAGEEASPAPEKPEADGQKAAESGTAPEAEEKPRKHGKLASISEYGARMPESQKYAYFACADSAAKAAQLPQVEPVLDAGYEVLYCTHDVDEFALRSVGKIGEKEIKSVADDDLGLESDAQKAEVKQEAEDSKELLDFLKESLGGAVASVRLSQALKTHPVVLTAEGPVSLEMEKYFSRMPDEAKAAEVKAQRVLEINPHHKVWDALKRAYAEDRDKAANYARILYYQALLIADMPVDEPTKFAELVCGLMD